MSILIRGMEMPEGCEECKIKRSRLSCPLTGHYVNNYRNERHNDCPLVEVPPYWRLISAELLKSEFTGNFRDAYEPALIKAMIDNSPTIIEAEPPKEEVNG